VNSINSTNVPLSGVEVGYLPYSSPIVRRIHGLGYIFPQRLLVGYPPLAEKATVHSRRANYPLSCAKGIDSTNLPLSGMKVA
jgi:hypothetical protein